MGKRIIRTEEQRLAADIERVAQRKKDMTDKAIELHEQAKAWRTRSEELSLKADGADALANAKLKVLGLDAAEFWAEHDKAE